MANAFTVSLLNQTPTVSASPAYTSGDCIGGKMSFTGAALTAGGSGLIKSVVVNCKSAQTGAFDLILFDSDPSSSTFTDNSAIAIAPRTTPKSAAS
jgi:hypothetical protein